MWLLPCQFPDCRVIGAKPPVPGQEKVDGDLGARSLHLALGLGGLRLGLVDLGAQVG